MNQEEFERKTRAVFDPIHKSQGEDSYIFSRLPGLLSTDYLKVDKDWFVGKICLDAGCGSNANTTYAMLHMGARKVYALDLDSGTGNTILESVPKHLEEFEGRYRLDLGNVLSMQYADDFFDFTHCSGVLHHTLDVYQGLKELARVTKKGGTLYVMINGQGGVVREITNLLRERYLADAQFQSFIDNLDRERLVTIFQWIVSEMGAHGDEMADKVPDSLLRGLFDRDLVLTIKDRIQSPVYHEHTEEELVNWLTDHGFTGVERLTRYPRYKNIRRFLSPLYNRYDHEIARLLYGSGLIQLKAIKAAG